MNEKEIAREAREAHVEREYWESLSKEVPKAKQRKLPSLVEQYVNSASEVSYYNEIPAALSYFVLLGQICKDMAAIPHGRRTDDTRIQLIWMQTSGTGKSELYNFFGPVSNYVFEVLNANHGTNFDIMDVEDTTDAGLIGTITEERETLTDDEGNATVVDVPVQVYGALEGSGLVAYDEFEYSGVFKSSQHKENVVMYMNKFMNSLHGNNHLIKKKLAKGHVLVCDCQRSIFATTYIPSNMTRVIAETGLMQRSVLFIREIPIELQNELRAKVADSYGTVADSAQPINQFGDAIVQVYECLKEHFEENGKDRTKTMRFAPNFRDSIKAETKKFENYVQSSRPSVLSLANNFITRMQGSMARMAVLCAITEAPTIKTKKNRYYVTDKHVQQSSRLIRACYKSLISWLDTSLRHERISGQDKLGIKVFKAEYENLKTVADSEGRVNKQQLLENVRKSTGKGQATIYRNYKELAKTGVFNEAKKGRSVYTKIVEKEVKE